MAVHMFRTLIDKLKANPRKIVFTEGTDARILEASARLLSFCSHTTIYMNTRQR